MFSPGGTPPLKQGALSAVHYCNIPGTHMNKFCYQCQSEKPLTSFPQLRKRMSGTCLPCYLKHYGDPLVIAARQYRKLKQKEKERRTRRVDECRLHVRAILQESSCMDCKCNDWVVFEFDHRDPTEKVENVSALMGKGKMAKMISEIKKCDVVCANCHARRTYKTNGSWRVLG